jgi:mono/diheme cytochrome c family protein
MQAMKYISMAVALAMWFTIAIAQQAAPSQNVPPVKRVPIKDTPSNDGEDMYDNYCAVCHGKDGRGTGPAAPAMKTSPTDLTALAKNNGGKYPASHVAAVLRGQATTSSHGSQDMPVWGPLFSRISRGHEGQVQQRIANLVSYLETLQAK